MQCSTTSYFIIQRIYHFLKQLLTQVNSELKEPIRREVLNFKFSPDRAVKRDIRMVLLDKKKPQSYEVEVSLNKNEITKIKPLDGIQPALMGSEYVNSY